jgi:hypothetical protein
VAKIPAIVSERKKVRTSIKLAGSFQTQESTPIVRVTIAETFFTSPKSRFAKARI